MLSTLTEAWTIEQAIEARRRDERLELCHRHRHMHYPFTLPGMKGSKKADDYYSNHVRESDLDSDESDVRPVPRRCLPQSRQARRVTIKQMESERDLLDHYLKKIKAEQDSDQVQKEHSKELESEEVQSDMPRDDESKSPAKKIAKVDT